MLIVLIFIHFSTVLSIRRFKDNAYVLYILRSRTNLCDLRSYTIDLKMARTHFSNIHLLKRHSWALNTFILDLKRSWRLNYSHWGELISRKVTSFNSKFSYKIDAFLLSTFRKNNIKKFLDKWSINFLIIGSRYMSHMRSQAKKTNAFSFFSINHLFEKDRGTRY